MYLSKILEGIGLSTGDGESTLNEVKRLYGHHMIQEKDLAQDQQ
jgi:hypothetical protein